MSSNQESVATEAADSTCRLLHFTQGDPIADVLVTELMHNLDWEEFSALADAEWWLRLRHLRTELLLTVVHACKRYMDGVDELHAERPPPRNA